MLLGRFFLSQRNFYHPVEDSNRHIITAPTLKIDSEQRGVTPTSDPKPLNPPPRPKSEVYVALPYVALAQNHTRRKLREDHSSCL